MDILIVEDEPKIARLIQHSLGNEGFSCRICQDGLSSLQVYRDQEPSLIVLDLMLPRLDGLEVCARIRQDSSLTDPYILMLTAKGEEIDCLIGLSTGADDYLTKPFSTRELIARVRALLRRSLRQGNKHQTYCKTQHFTVDLEQRSACRQLNSNHSETLDLTSLEFDLLATLVSHPGRVWNRVQLTDKLWGSDFFGDTRVIDNHISRLRKKVEIDPAHPTFIKTVVTVGYKFDDLAVQ